MLGGLTPRASAIGITKATRTTASGAITASPMPGKATRIADSGMVVVRLNDEQHHRGAELHEGDTVTFLPPIAGG